MVGETGTGKTTLLNTIVNHMMGVKFEDNVWYEITEEHQQDTSTSQTAFVTVYEIHVEEWPISLTIIDTPGYGDTRDMDRDKTIAENLCTLFQSYGGLDRINAVGLVVKSTQNRLTEFQHYVFDSVLSLFGKDIEKNVVILITHSDGLFPKDALNAVKNANTRCATDDRGEPVHYLFNNRQCEPHKENQTITYKQFWQLGEASIHDFFTRLEGTMEQSLKMTTDVLRKRKQLEAHLQDLITTISVVNEEEKQLEDIKKVVRENKEKLDNNESFTFWAEETTIEKVNIKDHFAGCNEKAMCCDVCKKNCHFPGCTWVAKLWWCAVMSDGKCTVCQCPHGNHSKEYKLYMPVSKKLKKTNEDLKKRYQDDHGQSVGIQRNIERDLTKKRQKMSELLQKAYDVIIRLDEIALHRESLNIHIDFDSLIERMTNTNQQDMIERLIEIRNRVPANSSSWRFWRRSQR